MYTEMLWRSAEDVWEQIMRHPFLVELHEGTLPKEKFAYFLGQDYSYLEDFARVLALGAARSPTGRELRIFLEAGAGVFSVEEALHATLTGDLGGDPQALGKAQRGPATQGYVDFLMRHGFAGDYARLLAAVLPCFWIYREVGLALTRRGPSPEPLYQAWIETYAGEAYGAAVRAQMEIVEGVLANSPHRLEELSAIFHEGVGHELRFWDQAYGLGI